MRKGTLGALALSGTVTLTLAACGGGNSSTSGTSGSAAPSSAGASSAAAGGAPQGKVGVILPDSKSSARWETADRPYLADAFKAAGVQYDIQNAQGDKSQFQTIADQMITNGATVLMIVNLDSGSGKAVLDNAKSKGVATIDYDRLTLGGSAQYYVSYDNVAVGKLQGEGLLKCLKDDGKTSGNLAYLNGSPTDNNATLFKQGYDGVIKQASGFKVVADQSVPDWDNAQGATIFEQILTANKQLDGAVTANDGLGNAAISVLKKDNLNGKVPVTGQDATVQGLQNVLAGDQCMTVFKDIKKEAAAGSALAISLLKGEQGQTNGTTNDPQGKRDVPSVILQPQSIFAANVKDVIDAGAVTKAKLCTGSYAARCAKVGIQ